MKGVASWMDPKIEHHAAEDQAPYAGSARLLFNQRGSLWTTAVQAAVIESDPVLVNHALILPRLWRACSRPRRNPRLAGSGPHREDREEANH